MTTSQKMRDVYLRNYETAQPLGEGGLVRFWSKVERTDGCWLWRSNLLRNGYGQFWYDGKPQNAHRVAWILTRGAIPDGQQVMHACDTPACVRPDHLSLGTQRDNMQDASSKGRLQVARRRTRKFKAEVIARYLAGGVTARELGAAYGISYMTVHRWVAAATNGQNQLATRAARGVHSSQRRQSKAKVAA